jgi:hypothetical protein
MVPQHPIAKSHFKIILVKSETGCDISQELIAPRPVSSRQRLLIQYI